MDDKTLQGFRVGDTAEIVHKITHQDVEKFVELTGDNNPLHVDRRFAERTSFKSTVAHGMLSASFISTIIGTKLPGEGALWYSQTLEFLLPVRIDDTLTIRAEVTSIHVTQRIMSLQIDVVNHHGQPVLTGVSRVRVLEVEPEVTVAPSPTISGVVIVTGASRGIGAATARRLAKNGFAVAVNFRSDEIGAHDVVESICNSGGTAIAFQADVTDSAAIHSMINEVTNRLGPVTALVNNATGKFIYKSFADVTTEDLDYYFDIQFKAPLNMIRALLPSFEMNKRGAVVNVASINADNLPANQLLGYTASKAALISATRSLAVEYGPKGFRFNIVSPGMTETSLVGDIPERARMLTKMQAPLRRLAEPEDVASGIAFLLSDEASHITGETLRICGGSMML